ncbi:hypothetical protein [Megasphaera elsdenii]|uniref:hypothetical protein n=1 Tax=Megasphaera elsdenii TaxID=907 RepID=UPI00242D2032|nr:hypothetical protein [Megasphaera elsdenii]
MGKYISVTRANGDLEYILLVDTKEYGYSYFSVLCSDGVTRYAQLGEKSDDNASALWIKQNGVKKYVIRIPNVTPHVYLTMGNYADIYGFSNTGWLNFGEISGTFTYNNKTVTIRMFEFSSGYVDFAMQIGDETSGTYNANVTLIDPDTGKQGSVYFSGMYYQSYNKAFIGEQPLSSGNLYDFFSTSNVGKKYVIKVDIAKV